MTPIYIPSPLVLYFTHIGNNFIHSWYYFSDICLARRPNLLHPTLYYRTSVYKPSPMEPFPKKSRAVLPTTRHHHTHRYKFHLFFVHPLTFLTILHSIHTDDDLIYTVYPITTYSCISTNYHAFLTSRVYVLPPTCKTSFSQHCYSKTRDVTFIWYSLFILSLYWLQR